ncbi:MAG: hypothetical protein ACHQ0J_04740 [Candidatus Dormibacterales bacterium]
MEEGKDRRISTPEHRAAYAAAKAAPTTHKPRLITSLHAREIVHGVGALGQFNDALAVAITKSVGTMWAAYVFTLLALCSLPAVISATGWIPSGFFPSWLIAASLISLVAWVAQTFLQLVLLPIIIVGQNVISAAQDARAEADHLTLTSLHEINVQQLQMLTQQRELLQQQREILDLLQRHEATSKGSP